MKACPHSERSAKIQADIIRLHINQHAYYRGYKDENSAVASFIKEYAWLMRETFCRSACDKFDTCEIINKAKINF